MPDTETVVPAGGENPCMLVPFAQLVETQVPAVVQLVVPLHVLQVRAPPQPSGNVPHFATAAQVVGWQQSPLVQELLAQSPARPHTLPPAHFVGHEPPQSTSVSAPFFTPSEHVAVWQTLLLHTPLRQSVVAAQPSPAAHFPHAGPPQSAPVSCPFFAPSVQVAAMQTEAVHTAL